MDTVEIRVHGIGDHDDYSALGAPVVESSTARADVVWPPALPGHPLKLVNWSRSSRGLSKGLLWYLAFPFTLANAAGNMGPAEGIWVRRLLRTAVTTAGVVLSIAAAAWLIVFAETILKVVPTPSDPRAHGRLVAFGVPFALAVSMIVRAKRHGLGVRRVVLRVNVAVLVAFGTLVAIWLPAQRTYTAWPSRNICPQRGAPLCSAPEERLDAMAAIVVLTTLAVLLIGGFLLVVRGFTDAKASLAGAATLLSVAIVAMHVFGSVLRMGLDWIFIWASDVEPGSPGTLSAWDRALMAYYDRGTVVSSRLDYIAVFGVLAAIAIGVSAWLVIRFAGAGKRPKPSPSGRDRAKWTHNVVKTMPARLGLILAWTAAIAVALSGLVVWQREWLIHGPLGGVAVRLIHVLTVVGLLAVFLRHRLPSLSKVMGGFADVVGFWPVEHHPLSGVSYRKSTLAGIDHAVGEDTDVVLVGHSQGSVVCAWWVRHRPEPLPKVSLVTCGSPLASLYRTFFPRHFTPEFFRAVKARSPEWKNFWRDTDPISTVVPEACDGPLVDPPSPDEKVKGHSGYWTDPAQQDWVARRIAAS